MNLALALQRRVARQRSRVAWVLGGGGARGAAQVGTLRALLESGIGPPSAVVGSSVGALDGGVMAACPSLEGTRLLRRLWMSEPARNVFRLHPLGAIMSQLTGKPGPLSPAPVAKLIERFEAETGCRTFEDLEIPLLVVATNLERGRPAVFRSGPLSPALLASTAIPGIFPPVRIGDDDYADGGIVDNVPIAIAFREGYRRILAIGLMAGAEMNDRPSSWSELIARTLQLSLHQRLLSDFERLRSRARIVIFCPLTPPEAAWDMRPAYVERLMAQAYEATVRLLAGVRGDLFERSAIHYLNLVGDARTESRTIWLADAL